jgi:hypothetical protein
MLREALIWLPVGLIPIVNGVVRVTTYGPRLGEPGASVISSAADLALIALYAFALESKAPPRSALGRGILWLSLTTLSHFGLGLAAFGLTWESLAAKYNVLAGETWGIISLGILFLPLIARTRVRPGRQASALQHPA